MGPGLLLVLSLAACRGPGDGERYVRALGGQMDYEAARDLCLGMQDLQGRWDCSLAVMEKHGRLDEDDCMGLPEGPWRDECRFLLAEREWRAGHHDQARTRCLSTRFARSCVYHLTRQAARAGETEPAQVAEARIQGFFGLDVAPDADQLFWLNWLDGRLALHLPVDAGACQGLASEEACREAAWLRVSRMLEGYHRARGQRFCQELEAGQVPWLIRDVPAWAPDPRLQVQVDQWRDRRCQGQPPAPPPPGAVSPGDGD